MAGTTSFLDRTAFEIGEFDRQSIAFQEVARGLAQCLEPYVGNGFRAEASRTADSFVNDALATVRSLLREREEIQDLVRHPGPETEGLRRFLEGKLVRYSPSASDLEPHIMEASDQLAQLVAALWLDRLERMLRGRSWIDLTSEMLPIGETARNLLRGLDLAEFPLEMRDVVEAFAAFRQRITDDATRTFQPIVLGARLFVVPDSRRQGGEYRLFVDPKSAQKFAAEDKRRVRAPEPSAWPNLGKAFARAYGAICESVISDPFPALDKTRVTQLTAYARSLGERRYAKEMRHGHLTAEFASIVETTIAAMVRGNLESAERAETYLRNEADGFAGRLRSVANEAGVPIEDAYVLFGTSVAAVISVQSEGIIGTKKIRFTRNAMAKQLLPSDAGANSKAGGLVVAAALGVCKGMKTIEGFRME